MLGVLTCFLYNVVVPKVASFRLTILTFVAQVFTSLVLDVLFGNGYSKVTLIGGGACCGWDAGKYDSGRVQGKAVRTIENIIFF